MKTARFLTYAVLVIVISLVASSLWATDSQTVYKNRYAERATASGSSFFKWQWERLTTPNQRAPKQPILPVEPNLELIKSQNQEVRVSWVGHATVLLQVDGISILTDPHWGNIASPIPYLGPKRHQAPGIPFEQLPPIDYVMISHNHYDHLDYDTVQQLMNRSGGKTQFLVPAGVDQWFAANVSGTQLQGSLRNVIPFVWDQSLTIAGKQHHHEIRFLAVQHWSARGLFDRYETLWGSWAFLGPDLKFWFSGDLGYSPDISDIYRQIGEVDLAAIAIGGYAPRWFMRFAHIDPNEAVQIMKELHAKQALAIHWGTFENLTDEPLDEPPEKLAQALRDASLEAHRFKVFKHGQTMVWKNNQLQ